MADKRTSEMVQRRAAYVPEGLRPSGWWPLRLAEKVGWYSGDIPEDFKMNGTGPWSIAEREYDTKPFGADIGVDPMMEYILRELLLGNSSKKAKGAVDKKAADALAAERNANQAGWVGESNSQSNRFGTQGDFNR